MEKEEKVKEKDVEKQEFFGIKLKRGVLVGKKGGNTTPSPTWRFGLTQADVSRPHDFTTATISARKLGANLWEVQPPLETSKGVPPPRSQRKKSQNKGRDCELPNQFNQPPDTQNPQQQQTTATNLRKHFVQQTMQHHGSVERNDDAIPPLSPGSSSSVEMTPYRPAITPNEYLYLKGRSRDSSNNLKTSTELVKVLNRIWSLEEQHTSNISLIKAMKKELDHARGQIRELLQEKKRHRQEMDDMRRHLGEDKGVRKQLKDSQVKDVIRTMRNEVEDERKLRKHSESLHRKLARQLSDVKSSFSNALKELERERKARMLLEDLCDEFAKGIRDYEQEIRFRKNRFEKDWTTQDRLILHLSEAWLDERMQMKLAETHSGFVDKKTIVDKLSLEIETFLKTKKSVSSVNDDMLLSKIPIGSNLRRSSLESFHLNEPGSAPQNGIDEEDFVDGGLYFSEVKRGSTPKKSNGSTKKQNEYAPSDHVAKIAKSNHMEKKFQLLEDVKDSDLLILQMQSEEQFLGDVSHNGNDSRLMNMEPAQTRGGNPAELTVFQTTEVDEVLGKNSPRNEYKEKENHDDLVNNRIRDPFSSECKQHHDNNNAENFDPSSFSGTASPVEKWTSKALAPHLEASESSSRWHQGIKENTLKAKLLEARLESQHSRSRASKVI